MPATAIGSYATATLLKARIEITNTDDDTQLGLVCDQVNAYIESPAACGRVLAPIASATYLIDGDGTDRIYFRNGIRAVTAISVGDYTGGARTALASTDYFLRPSTQDRPNGWPATYLVLSDLGSRRYFPRGFETVSVTATTGWAAIPDEITDIALTAAARAWHAVESGQTDIVGTDEMGRPVVSRFFSARDFATLRAYSVNLPG